MSPSHEPSTDNEKLVVQFFAAMGRTYGEMRTAFERYLAEDCVWANQGLPEVRGKHQILQFLQAFVDQTGLQNVNGRVLNIASTGDIVLTERHEHWTGKDGAVLVESLPVMGAFHIGDGKIMAWRDYFDPGRFAHLASQT